MEKAVVSGIAFNRGEAKISVLGVPDTPAWPLPSWVPWLMPTSKSM